MTSTSEKLENWLNRNRPMAYKKAIGNSTPMEHDLTWFIIFANIGAALFLGVVAIMMATEKEITQTILRDALTGPMAFFLNSSIAIIAGSGVLTVVSRLRKRKSAP